MSFFKKKSQYEFVKRSNGQRILVSSQAVGSKDMLSSLPFEELLSPNEVTDTFELFEKKLFGFRRVKFRNMFAERFSSDEHHVFLFATSRGNASIVIAKRNIGNSVVTTENQDQPHVTIIMHQVNFSGGKTTAMIALANMLQNAGCKVKIVCLWLTSTPPKYNLPAGVSFDYVDSYMEMEAGEKQFQIEPPDMVISDRTASRFKDYFSTLQTDVLYVPDYDSGLHALIFHALPPSVVRILGDHNPGRASAAMEQSAVPNKKKRNKMFYAASKLADAVHVVNPSLRELYAKSLLKPILSIPNPVQIRNDLVADAFASRTVIVVGRFVQEKSIPDAIEAFAEATRDRPEWKLEIYGRGPDQEEIEITREYSTARDRITILEPTPNILDRMADCAIHLSASKMESFGLTLAEAIGIGVLVVSRHHAGSVFLLAEKRGSVAKDNTVASLSTALRDIIEQVEKRDPKLQDQISSGKLFAETLTREQLGKQWLDTIVKLSSSTDR